MRVNRGKSKNQIPILLKSNFCDMNLEREGPDET